ncbi:MAG: sialidase family protein [Promethearchaeota archaeon]
MSKITTLLCFFILLLLPQLSLTSSFDLASIMRATPTQSSAVLSNAPSQATDIRFGANTRVTDGSSPYPEQVEPTLTILSSGRLLIGWKEADTYDGAGLRVGFCYSDDEGKTFSPNILMDTLGGGSQSDPWLISDNDDNAYFTFLEYQGSAEGMGVAKTTDGGEIWQAPTQAADTVGFLDDKETACVDASGNIYMMWDHFVSNSQANLVFTKSVDGGTSFQPTQVLGPWDTHGGIPYLTCTPNGTLFVTTIWDSVPDGPLNTIHFMKSTDYGNTWSAPMVVNPPGYPEIAIITVCAVDSNHHLYICFAAGYTTDKEVYVIKSTDGGDSWSAPVQVNDITTNMQRMVEMHIDADDNIHVAWLDARNGEWDIYYSYSTDGGASFSDDYCITSEGFPLSFTRPGDYITLRSDSTGKLFIVWTDGRAVTDQDIYIAKQDISAPVITAFPIAPPSQFQPVTFSVEVEDDDRVASVDVYYQIDSGFVHQFPMFEVSENNFKLIVPGSQIVGHVLSYYFVANDSAGRYTRLPSETSEFISVQISAFSPTLIITIVAAVIVIVLVIVIAIWYLRKN